MGDNWLELFRHWGVVDFSCPFRFGVGSVLNVGVFPVWSKRRVFQVYYGTSV